MINITPKNWSDIVSTEEMNSVMDVVNKLAQNDMKLHFTYTPIEPGSSINSNSDISSGSTLIS